MTARVANPHALRVALLMGLFLATLVNCRSIGKPALPATIRREAAPNPASLYQDDRVGIVVYAPSTFSRQLKCEALVESIRSQGRWGGRLYLITEQLKCYQHERWMQCGLDADIIALDDTAARESVKHEHKSGWWRVMFGPMWDLVKTRMVRAQLWELLQPPPTMKALVYIHGCEVLVGAPLQPFIEQAVSQYNQPQPPSVLIAAPATVPPSRTHHEMQRLMLLPTATGPSAGVVGGSALMGRLSSVMMVAGEGTHGPLEGSGSVWVLHKQASAALMGAWRHEVLNAGLGSNEEDLLEGAIKRVGGTECKGSKQALRTCMARSIAWLYGWSQKLWCDEHEGCGGSAVPATFNYIPGSVCTKNDHVMVADWVNTLDLCVYQDLGYCLPMLMQPFAHSWLPYPQCGKLELGLSRLSCQWSCTEPTVVRSPGFRTSVTSRSLPLTR